MKISEKTNYFLTESEMVPLLLVVLSVVLVETETALIHSLVRISDLCIPEKKYVILGNIRSGKRHSGNCPSAKCLWGTVSHGNIRQGKVRWGNVR